MIDDEKNAGTVTPDDIAPDTEDVEIHSDEASAQVSAVEGSYDANQSASAPACISAAHRSAAFITLFMKSLIIPSTKRSPAIAVRFR